MVLILVPNTQRAIVKYKHHTVFCNSTNTVAQKSLNANIAWLSGSPRINTNNYYSPSCLSGKWG